MSNWHNCRIKDAVNLVSVKTEDFSLPYIALDNIVSWDAQYIPSESESDGNSNECQPGDVLFGKLRPYLAKAYIPTERSICSPEFLVMRPNNGTHNKFMLYYLLSKSFIAYIKNQVAGTKMPRTKWTDLGSVSFSLPPLAEQEAIAEYLDKECEKIGREIVLLERKANAYRRLRRSVIMHAVSSLRPHYISYRLKDIFELRNGYTPSKAVNEFWEGGTIPWFRMEDIRKNGRILSDSIQHITPEAIKSAGLFEANSFILATTATIGEHAWLIADSLANQQFTNLKIRKSLFEHVVLKYIFYLFFLIDEYCKRAFRITTFAAVDMTDLCNMPIALPPIEEQQEIAAYLDEKCGKIDAIIEKIATKVERLKELKRSLINEVVTGRRAI